MASYFHISQQLNILEQKKKELLILLTTENEEELYEFLYINNININNIDNVLEVIINSNLHEYMKINRIHNLVNDFKLNIYNKNIIGQNALLLSIKNDNFKLLKELINKYNIDFSNDLSKNLFYYLMKHNKIDENSNKINNILLNNKEKKEVYRNIQTIRFKNIFNIVIKDEDIKDGPYNFNDNFNDNNTEDIYIINNSDSYFNNDNYIQNKNKIINKYIQNNNFDKKIYEYINEKLSSYFNIIEINSLKNDICKKILNNDDITEKEIKTELQSNILNFKEYIFDINKITTLDELDGLSLLLYKSLDIIHKEFFNHMITKHFKGDQKMDDINDVLIPTKQVIDNELTNVINNYQIYNLLSDKDKILIQKHISINENNVQNTYNDYYICNLNTNVLNIVFENVKINKFIFNYIINNHSYLLYENDLYKNYPIDYTFELLNYKLFIKIYKISKINSNSKIYFYKIYNNFVKITNENIKDIFKKEYNNENTILLDGFKKVIDLMFNNFIEYYNNLYGNTVMIGGTNKIVNKNIYKFISDIKSNKNYKSRGNLKDKKYLKELYNKTTDNSLKIIIYNLIKELNNLKKYINYSNTYPVKYPIIFKKFKHMYKNINYLNNKIKEKFNFDINQINQDNQINIEEMFINIYENLNENIKDIQLKEIQKYIINNDIFIILDDFFKISITIYNHINIYQEKYYTNRLNLERIKKIIENN